MTAPSAPAISPLPSLGSTRQQHMTYDWSQLSSTTYSNFGPGQAPNWVVDKAQVGSPARGGAWGNLSGINKTANGFLAAFLAATSFNIGSFSTAIIPVVGRKLGSQSSTYLPVETQQYWSLQFQVAQGAGVPQSGFTPRNPPYIGPQQDVGIFFFQSDLGFSASSYQKFTDLGGAVGGQQGFGFWLDNFGNWNYGIRYAQAATPLDISVPLTAGTIWPVPTPGGVPDYTAFATLLLEFFAPGVLGENSAAGFKASLNGRTIINTTFADIGVAPVGAGLNAQLPDFYSESSLNYGIIGAIRCGGGTIPGNASGTMTANGLQPTGASVLNLAITTPGGSFEPGDKLVVAGQTFQVGGAVAIPAAATVTVPIVPNVGAAIPDTTPVTYTAQPQTFPVCFNNIEYISGPFVPTTVASP